MIAINKINISKNSILRTVYSINAVAIIIMTKKKCIFAEV